MMKLIALIFALGTISVPAYAGPLLTENNLNSSSSATQSTSATGTATNAGNTQSITFTSPPETKAVVDTKSTTTVDSKLEQTGTVGQNVNYSGSYTVQNVPSVSGPALVTSNDTCMGSTSGSINIAGLGIGGGTSWVDDNCKMLKNSRELWNMGMKAAALALMCTDAANKEALELTGFECPQTTKAKAAK